MMRAGVARIANVLSKEQARALPDSKGGEEPKQLQASRTEIYTHFTRVGGTELLYSAENWVRVTLLLETAGPVSIGTMASLTPVLGGAGILLDTDVPFQAVFGKGNRLYSAAETINRVKVVIEPIPWLEQIDMDVQRLGGIVANTVAGIVNGIVGGIRGRAAAAPTSSSGKTPQQLPCPPGDRVGSGRLPRLTGLGPSSKMRR
jgi:hypothetical protein